MMAPGMRVATSMERLRTWNSTSTDYPRDRTVAQLFEEIAAYHAHSIALVFEGRDVTYAELNLQANRLAHRLREAGVGTETMVGCCMQRSVDLIVALLAILKAGGAYVPLDPAYPEERLKLFLDDVRPQVVLTQHSAVSTALAQWGQTCLAVDTLADPQCGLTEANLPPAGGAKSLAYVMYTSGSTGRPKGVMVENRAIVRLVRNTNFCCFGPDEVFLQFAPISFDASTLEIWGALLNGGRLVVMPPQMSSLADIGRVIREQNVTTLWLSAGLFSVMVDERLDDLRGVRQLLAGGDVLSPRHVRQALASLPDCRLINGYGPTENTTFTCCHVMSPGENVPEPVPIGRPISNTQAYVLDEQLQPLPPGAVGELYAAGDGLARGYLNNPELTEQKFLRNPFVAEADARMYRTGDLARWREDGVLEFQARTDHQVKILGHRVEPGEIETALNTHRGVRQNCVVAHSDQEGSKRLVAYYVSVDSELTGTQLRKFLAEKLPSHMIPALFVHVDALPLTPNGKINRAALPMPTAEFHAASAAVAETQLEAAVVASWRQALGDGPIGVTDNFFDLGGDSLLLVRVHAALERTLQIKIPIVSLFEFPTVRSLANYLGNRLIPDNVISDVHGRAQKQRAAFARQRERRMGHAS
jgi:aspartate racemase